MRAHKHWHKSLTDEAIIDAIERQMATLGAPASVSSAASRQGVKPDARNYECEISGSNQVLGAAELLLHIA
jgi:hypothetical protein